MCGLERTDGDQALTLEGRHVYREWYEICNIGRRCVEIWFWAECFTQRSKSHEIIVFIFFEGVTVTLELRFAFPVVLRGRYSQSLQAAVLMMAWASAAELSSPLSFNQYNDNKGYSKGVHYKYVCWSYLSKQNQDCRDALILKILPGRVAGWGLDVEIMEIDDVSRNTCCFSRTLFTHLVKIPAHVRSGFPQVDEQQIVNSHLRRRVRNALLASALYPWRPLTPAGQGWGTHLYSSSCGSGGAAEECWVRISEYYRETVEATIWQLEKKFGGLITVIFRSELCTNMQENNPSAWFGFIQGI